MKKISENLEIEKKSLKKFLIIIIDIIKEKY